MKLYKKYWFVVVAVMTIGIMVKLTQTVSAVAYELRDYKYEDPIMLAIEDEISSVELEKKEVELEALKKEILKKEAEEARIREEEERKKKEAEERRIAKEKKEAEEKEAREIELARLEKKEDRRAEKQEYKSASRGMALPNTNTRFKAYMDYRKITSKSSPQYRLQRNGQVYTDNKGFRRLGNDYIIAVGTFYSNRIGERLEVTMQNGNRFTATVGDIKANIHTDSSNRYVVKDGSILEFLVDTPNLDPKAKRMGDMSYATPIMQGPVAAITKLN